MKVHWERGGTIAVFRPSGDLWGDDQSDALTKAVLEVFDKGNRACLIDLGNVGIVSSYGLSRILELHRRYQKAQGQIMLCNIAMRLQSMLAITRLSEVFEVHEHERDALASFRPEPASPNQAESAQS